MAQIPEELIIAAIIQFRMLIVSKKPIAVDLELHWARTSKRRDKWRYGLTAMNKCVICPLCLLCQPPSRLSLIPLASKIQTKAIKINLATIRHVIQVRNKVNDFYLSCQNIFITLSGKKFRYSEDLIWLSTASYLNICPVTSSRRSSLYISAFMRWPYNTTKPSVKERENSLKNQTYLYNRLPLKDLWSENSDVKLCFLIYTVCPS